MAKARNRRAGYTLTEAAIVLGIAGIIFGSIWLAASSVTETNTLRTASESIVKIAQNVRLLYIERNSFTSGANTDLTIMLTNAGVFPDDTLNTSGEPSTPWGTLITVIVASPTSFELNLAGNMPTDQCMKLSMMMIGPGREPALTSISQNGGGEITTLDDKDISDLSPCTSASFTFNLN